MFHWRFNIRIQNESLLQRKKNVIIHVEHETVKFFCMFWSILFIFFFWSILLIFYCVSIIFLRKWYVLSVSRQKSMGLVEESIFSTVMNYAFILSQHSHLKHYGDLPWHFVLPTYTFFCTHTHTHTQHTISIYI